MNKQNQDISVVIVTKNRARDLLECISSLLVQSESIQELIIVDNNSQDETQRIVENLQKNCRINIRYVLEKKVGYPIVYNRGLAEASTTWVAFIDDDCVADKDWYKNVNQSINTYLDASVIVGKSDTYYSKNVFSLATVFFDQMWKENGKINNKITHFATLDNKNIIYNKKFLKKNKLRFNETRIKINGGAAEDVDLGLRIQEHGGVAYYNSDILVRHKDPTTFQYFFSKLRSASKSARSVEAYTPIKVEGRKFRLRNWFNIFCKANNIQGLLRIQLFLLIVITIVGSKRFGNL